MAFSPAAVYDYGFIRSLVVYRKAPFQVELFLVAPGGGFPQEHRHPNVDSFEVHIFGDLPLTINGVRAIPTIVNPKGDRPIHISRVLETDWHGAAIMPNGGAFFSIQYWLNGVPPTSVGLNWEGSPVSSEHAILQATTSGSQ